jgi:RHS repeat-associated protein
MRSLRLCGDYHLTYRASTECKVGFVRRTIWDGNQELAEIQAPWTIEIYQDTTSYRALADSDVTPMNFPQITTQDGTGGDPNKLFGHVVYAGFMGTDQPIAITRVNYAWIQDWYNPSPTNLQSPAQVQAPFTIISFWDMKGDAPQGVIATGERTLCNLPTSFNKCIAFQWPWDWSSTDRQRNLPRAVWHGSMLEGKRDKSGLGYSRNRYYDPSTGRFTQEDPIGLAGGINLYGFGGGDALNFKDPFGLCKVDVQFSPVMHGYHAYIVTTAPDNTRLGSRGGPEHEGVGSLPAQASSATDGAASGSSRSSNSQSSGASNSASPGASNGNGAISFMGALDAHAAQPYDREHFRDYDPGNPPRQRVVDNNESCDKYNKSFSATADAINAANIGYNPLTTNSNAVVTEMLRKAGIPVPAPIVLAHGWGTRLIP